jgi:hypothetical protein
MCCSHALEPASGNLQIIVLWDKMCCSHALEPASGNLPALFFYWKATIYGRLGFFSGCPWLPLVTAMQECQGSQQDRPLVRKALKSALSHLKADHAADFHRHVFPWSSSHGG